MASDFRLPPTGLRPRLPAPAPMATELSYMAHAQGHGRLRPTRRRSMTPGGRPALALLATSPRPATRGRTGRAESFDLRPLDAENRALVADTLGEGEVAARIRGIPAVACRNALRRGLGADRRRIDRSRSPPIPRPRARPRLHRAAPRQGAPTRPQPRRHQRPADLGRAGRQVPRRITTGGTPHVVNLHPPAPYRGRPLWLDAALGEGRGHDPQPRLRQLPGDGDRLPACLAGAVLQLHGHADPRHVRGDRDARGRAWPRPRTCPTAQAPSEGAGGDRNERVRGRLSPLRHRAQPAGVLECKICWTVYDPPKGAISGRSTPARPSRAARGLDLPHLRRGEDAVPGADRSRRARHAEEAMIRARTRALEAEFTEIWHAKMRDVPMVNASAGGPRRWASACTRGPSGRAPQPVVHEPDPAARRGRGLVRLSPAEGDHRLPLGRLRVHPQHQRDDRRLQGLFALLHDGRLPHAGRRGGGRPRGDAGALRRAENQAETDRSADIRAAREAEVAAENPTPIDPEPSRRAVITGGMSNPEGAP
jgi:hypothetical protein